MSQRTANWYLIVRTGPKTGSAYPLNANTIVIGRHGTNQIVINDPRVSRQHARLTRNGNTFLLEDLGSANGTWLNDKKVVGPTLLAVGNVVGLGQEIQLVFSDHAYDDATIFESPSNKVSPAVIAASSSTVPTKFVHSKSTPNWLLIGLGALIVITIIGLSSVAVSLLLTRGISKDQTLAVVIPTVTPGSTELPTYTPYPTYTPIPTDAPTATPYPTYTPVPVNPPTATPYPTYTPFPTPEPTATPQPTFTPVPPPATSQPIPPTPVPTATFVLPTNTPEPSYSITLGSNVHYEPWGNPGHPDGCNGPYDDRIEVRRFYAQVLLTNNSDKFIAEGWDPTFLTASGAGAPSCVFYYNNLVVEPRETIDVTYGTHIQVGDYVKALVFDILGHTEVICLTPSGQQTSCN